MWFLGIGFCFISKVMLEKYSFLIVSLILPCDVLMLLLHVHLLTYCITLIIDLFVRLENCESLATMQLVSLAESFRQ